MRKSALTTLGSLSPKKRKLDQTTNTESIPDPAILIKDQEIMELKKELAILKRKNDLLEQKIATMQKLKTKKNM